jgi:hypothetical protein
MATAISLLENITHRLATQLVLTQTATTTRMVVSLRVFGRLLVNPVTGLDRVEPFLLAVL